jgi:hypothetical protein
LHVDPEVIFWAEKAATGIRVRRIVITAPLEKLPLILTPKW